MEKDREWEAAALEEESGGLEVRPRHRRRSGVSGREKQSDSFEEEREVAEAVGEGQQRSVYCDKERGVEITAETAPMNLYDEVQSAAEDTANGKVNFRTKEFHGQEDIPVQEANNILKNTKVENGSNSQHYSEGYNENEITQSQHEIDRHKEIRIVKKSELKVSDVDLERVLEEQDTHDLFCPNCHSCITRRVILRKRKRWERRPKETESDAPVKKVHEIWHDVDSSHAAAEMTDPVDREPDIFRCLSCFSFFIPTEGGFNIFRIFEKREENQNLQSSQQIPETNMNWILSIFKSGTSKRKESEPGVQLPVESSIICEEQTENLSLKGKQSMPATIVEGTAQLGQSLTLIEKNLAGSLSEESYIIHEEQLVDPSQKEEQNLAATVSGSIYVGVDQTTTMRSDTGSTLPGESYVTSSRQIEDQSQRDRQSTVAQPVVEVALHDNFQTNHGERLGSAILYNDRGDDFSQVGEKGISLSDESIHSSVVPAVVVLPHAEIQIHEPEQSTGEARRKNDWDVLKSIVYGGLIESITSLSVVSSAAGTGASTWKIVALGLANLIGGFFIIVHDLFELRIAQDEATDQKGEPAGRYWEVLGRRANFKLHATVAVLSYLLVGSIPPLIYGFSFQESDNMEYKLIAVAAAGLLCITLLAIGKAHIKPQKPYIKYLLLYIGLGVSASGLSYVAGLMINRLLEKLGLFDSNTSSLAPPSIIYRDISSTVPAWSSY